jgi:hypothetical protein
MPLHHFPHCHIPSSTGLVSQLSPAGLTTAVRPYSHNLPSGSAKQAVPSLCAAHTLIPLGHASMHTKDDFPPRSVCLLSLSNAEVGRKVRLGVKSPNSTHLAADCQQTVHMRCQI